MRGKDLLYGLSFIDDDLVEEAGNNELHMCFVENTDDRISEDAGNISNETAANGINNKRSRRRRLISAACFIMAVGAAAVSQIDMNDILFADKDIPVNESSGNSLENGTDFDGLENGAEYSDADEGESSSVNAGKQEGVGSGSQASNDRYLESGYEENYKKNDVEQNYSGSISSEISPETADEAENSASSGSCVSAPSNSADSGAGGAQSGGSGGSGGDSAANSGEDAANGGNAGENTAIYDSEGSFELVKYLSELEYSQKAYKGDAEYTVTAKNGTIYEINLSAGFVRNGEKQAELTEEQIQEIRSLI